MRFCIKHSWRLTISCGQSVLYPVIYPSSVEPANHYHCFKEKEMKSYRSIRMLCLLSLLFLLNGCGGEKYADVKEANEDVVKAMESYMAELDKSENAKDVAKAMDHFADKMEALVPKMKKLAEKYPELEDASDLPEELKDSQEKLEALGQKFAGSMMKLMPYLNDPEVQKAQERMNAVMADGMN